MYLTNIISTMTVIIFIFLDRQATTMYSEKTVFEMSRSR